jgi:hypothetical protein
MTKEPINAITAAWEALTLRDRTVLELRLSGATLDQVGVTIGVTRERVRQIQLRAEETLLTVLDTRPPPHQIACPGPGPGKAECAQHSGHRQAWCGAQGIVQVVLSDADMVV